jgi:hypothetical protein
VNPDRAVRNKEGKPYTVSYDQVNAMLLNKFLKEHHKTNSKNRRSRSRKRKLRVRKSKWKRLLQGSRK